VLRAGVRAIYDETVSSVDFEGKSGVSPREMRTLLLDAAQSVGHACLSPFAVLHELDELCKRTSEFDWLKEKPLAGGYNDHRLFRDVTRRRLLDTIEEEMRVASGLVDEIRYNELFDRYITHVSVWVKGEKIRNAHTGAHENPDERMMREVEGLLGVKQKHEEHRRGLISTVAAWAIDHPGEKIVNPVVFPQPMKRLRETVFVERRKGVAQVVRDLVSLLRDQRTPSETAARGDLHEEARKKAQEALVRLQGMGYCDSCALEAASAVLRARFAELVN
jgi:predicted Ser/Thr protein kinase